MKLTPKEIKEGNALIAKAIGYTHYHKGVLMKDEYKGYEFKEIFSKIPIEVDEYPEDEQCYFKDFPNPDFGKERGERWNPGYEFLDWGILHSSEYIYDLKYHLDWNELMHAWEIFSEKSLMKEFGTTREVIEIRTEMMVAMIGNNLSLAFTIFVEAIKLHKEGLLKK